MNIPERLRDILLDEKLSAKSFAEKYGLNARSMQIWIKGDSAISVEALAIIANKNELLNLHWLITGKGTKYLSMEEKSVYKLEEPIQEYDSYRSKYYKLLEKHNKVQEDLIESLKTINSKGLQISDG